MKQTSWSVCVLAAGFLAACTEDNAEYVGDGGLGEAAPLICTPDAFIKCTASNKLQMCNSAGTGTYTVDCGTASCDPVEKRCDQCDPGTAPYCDGNTLVTCTATGLLVRTPCPAGCAGSKCVGCAEQLQYLDGDHDGYGNPAVSVKACVPPQGYVSNDADCDDMDPAAHPGQVAYFVVPTKGANNYDYNCNEVEEAEVSNLVACSVKGGNCVGDGWADEVPACGVSGSFARCLKGSGSTTTCTQKVTPQTQACR